jgi:hypothetical protein
VVIRVSPFIPERKPDPEAELEREKSFSLLGGPLLIKGYYHILDAGRKVTN